MEYGTSQEMHIAHCRNTINEGTNTVDNARLEKNRYTKKQCPSSKMYSIISINLHKKQGLLQPCEYSEDRYNRIRKIRFLQPRTNSC